MHCILPKNLDYFIKLPGYYIQQKHKKSKIPNPPKKVCLSSDSRCSACLAWSAGYYSRAAW